MTNIPIHLEIPGLPDPVSLNQTPPSVRQILIATAQTFGVSATRMLGPESHRVLCDARLAAAYLALRLTPTSSTTAAKVLNRTPASVRWAARKAAVRAASDTNFRNQVLIAAERAMALVSAGS